MITLIWSILAFLFAIGILIAFHEFGHFIVARCLGVKILRFSIGFGKPLWRKYDKRGTEYQIAAIPLGGYVKMLDENEGAVTTEDLPKAFNRKPIWARTLIVAAGPVFNIILAIFFYWLMFVVGIVEVAPIAGVSVANSIAAKAGLKAGDEIIAIDQKPTLSWQAVNLALLPHIGLHDKALFDVQNIQTKHKQQLIFDLQGWNPKGKESLLLKSLGIRFYEPSIPLKIAKVLPNSPAEKAGIKSGDTLIRMANQPITNWFNLAKLIDAAAGKTEILEIERNGKLIQLSITPERITTEAGKIKGRIGVESAPIKLPPEFFHKVRYPLFSALAAASEKTYTMIQLTFLILYKMIVGQISLRSISGPIGIAEGAGYSAQLGFSYYLDFLGLISISLGVINILPIPLLDGGHLLYYLLEVIRGKPLSRKAQEMGMRMGLVILICFMMLAIFNDFSRIF